MDLRYALRSLRNNPGFTALAVLVMALGIGANTAVFSVVNAVLLKPLAYRDPDRIVTIRNFWKPTSSIGTQVSAPDFHDWHEQSTAFDAMAYYALSGRGGTSPTAVLVGSSAEYSVVTAVSSEFFDVFQVHPLAGRMFAPEEQKPGSGGAALISDAYWQAHFGGNANALGRTVRIFDKSFPIVGVLPPGFQFPGKTEIWLPSSMFPENLNRSAHNYFVVGRLKPDVRVDQAQAQLGAIAAKIEQAFPNSNAGKGVTVVGMLDTLVSNVRLTLYMLLGAVGLVLLIACANMANLLLAKSTSRTREIAIRAAVGASRGRIIRQLITESLVLAAGAGVAGLTLAVWGADALVALAPSNVPRLSETGIDRWVLAFTFGISILSSVLFGLAPAIHASRVDLNDSLKQGASKNVVGGGAGSVRNALVVAEIALSVILLTGAGLLMRSFQALVNVDVGYRTERILVIETNVPVSDDEKGWKRAVQFDDDVLADLRGLPGVTAVGASAATPGSPGSNGSYWVDALPPREQLSITKAQAVFSVIGSGTFDTLGIPLKRGRDFNDGDTHEAFFTAIVNEALVKESFGGRDPMGQLIFCGLDSVNPMKIVGVVGNVREFGPSQEPWPEIYMPYPQHPSRSTGMSLLVRTPADPLGIAEAVRRKVRERSSEVPVKITPLSASFDQSVAAPRFRTLLLGVFAGLAVCLAMAGVYGVMAYIVNQRSNEIGLRMALGAQSSDVLKLVFRQALILTVIGLALGLAGAFAASRILTNLLFEVKPNDPLTYVTVSAILALVALAACYIPARRAAKVDPLVALRQE